MNLLPQTKTVLKNATSIHKPGGFKTEEEIREFWHKHGAKGFLNIKEITISMAQEIRRNIAEQKRTSA